MNTAANLQPSIPREQSRYEVMYYMASLRIFQTVNLFANQMKAIMTSALADIREGQQTTRARFGGMSNEAEGSLRERAVMRPPPCDYLSAV